MAKVSLRIYNREIESLVDRGQLEEAIAHCRHILNAFPKELETYRLLGKAYLEARRYEEATDIFERLLMAVPDDFVAHVGMSIIHDEQKDMDAAIWHMERAFEVQPSNAAIQAELQRLFGRRDGIEPPKIRLTRGALAHMYVQGELYPQAVSEIKAVLEEDRERQDMQVLLARAYFHAGQKGEAAEICSQLLRRYPYCFDANRVLVELLPETERGESTQVYRNRVNELDPYAAFATGSVFHTEEVPDAAVSLERLDWNGQPVDLGPGWRDSLSIGSGEKASAGDEEPDWLKTDLSAGAFDASMPTEEPASLSGGLPVPSAGGEEEIPAFLREAGWGKDTGTFKEGPVSFDAVEEPTEEPALAEGDLPDWIKAMAPTGVDLEASTPQAEMDEALSQDNVPDWLQGLGDVQEPASEEQPLAPGNLPDWLESMKPADETMPEFRPEEQGMAQPAGGDEGLPDWLRSIQAEDEAVLPPEIPQELPPEPVEEIPAVSPEALSDWQIEEEAAAETVAFDETDTGALGTSVAEQDDAIAWLESLAAKHGAKPEELVTKPEDRSETEPEWVQQAKAVKEQETLIEPVPQEEPFEEPSAGLPDFLAEVPAEPTEEAKAMVEPIDTGKLGTSAQEQDDAIAWLESLAAKHGAKPEELVTAPEARKETAPEWVQQAAEAGAAQLPVEEPALPEEPMESELEWREPVQQAGEPPYAEEVQEAREEAIPSAGVDETGMWLRDLGEETGVMREQEPAGEVETPAMGEEMPDWLREMEAEASKAEAGPASDEAAPEIPAWLLGAETEPAATEGFPAVPSTEEPSWEAAQEFPGKVDINTASIEQLAALPGIGSLLAQNIVAHREAFGAFASIEELSNVAGIGPATIDELRGLVEFRGTEVVAEPGEPSLTDWLQSVTPEEAAVGFEATTTEEAPSGDLPSWLAGLDVEAEQPASAVSSDEGLPDWLREVEEKEAVQAEPTASAEWRPTDIPSPIPEERPEIAFTPEPVAEEPPLQAAPPPPPVPRPEPKPAPPAMPEREPYREPVTRSRSGMTGMLSAAQDPALTQAQIELTRGNIPGAMESYGKLIKKGKLLEEIIFDLREALYRYPVEVSILQALGDAYMRANRLQDALDAYTKAEELLR